METLIRTDKLEEAYHKVENGFVAMMDCLVSAKRHWDIARDEMKCYERERQRIMTGLIHAQEEVEGIKNGGKTGTEQ